MSKNQKSLQKLLKIAPFSEVSSRRIFKQCLKVDLYLQLKESSLRRIYERKHTLRKIEIPPPKYERRHSHLPLIMPDKIIPIYHHIPFARKDKK